MSAQDARHNLGALGTPSGGSTYGFRSVVMPGASPSANQPGDLAVAPSSGMTVAINPGGYEVDFGAAVGPYTGAITSTVTVTLTTSNPSNPRIDYVVLRVRDPGIATSTTESAKIVYLTGTPSANPAEPSAQLTTGDMLLAAVTVRANTSSILAADISDRRRFGAARGGIYPAWNGDAVTGAYEGQYRDNGPYNQLERWSGTAWEAVAVPSVWNTFTPRLVCNGTGTDISIGSGASYVGRYQLVGRRLDFNIFFKWGTSPYNGGSGDIHTFLPVHPVTGAQLYGVGYSQWVMAHLWVNNASWVGDFFGQALVQANSTLIIPFFSICAGHSPPNNPVNLNTAPYRIATTQGQTDGKSSVPQIYSANGKSAGFPEGGDLECTGSCEVTW